MGKGDQKSRRGKLFRGSYGARRPRKSKKVLSVVSSTRGTAGSATSQGKAVQKSPTGDKKALKE